MLSPTHADRRLRKNKIVWTALAASVLVYFAVALLIPPAAVPAGPAGNQAAANNDVERVLMALAAAYVLLTIPLKRWLLAQAAAVDSDFLRGLAFLVPLVLCEAAALTGIVLRLVVGSAHYYVFLLLGLAGMLLNFPRRAPTPGSGS